MEEEPFCMNPSPCTHGATAVKPDNPKQVPVLKIEKDHNSHTPPIVPVLQDARRRRGKVASTVPFVLASFPVVQFRATCPSFGEVFVSLALIFYCGLCDWSGPAEDITTYFLAACEHAHTQMYI